MLRVRSPTHIHRAVRRSHGMLDTKAGLARQLSSQKRSRRAMPSIVAGTVSSIVFEQLCVVELFHYDHGRVIRTSLIAS